MQRHIWKYMGRCQAKRIIVLVIYKLSYSFMEYHLQHLKDYGEIMGLILSNLRNKTIASLNLTNKWL